MLGWDKIFDPINKMQIKSITDSVFRFSAMLFAFSLIAAMFKTYPWVIISLFTAAFTSLFFALYHFNYHSKRNPDYLRSETFQQNKQIIDILGDKDNILNPNVREFKYISSPYSKENKDGLKHQLGEHNK